jgi:hypothetical protein
LSGEELQNGVEEVWLGWVGHGCVWAGCLLDLNTDHHGPPPATARCAPLWGSAAFGIATLASLRSPPKGRAEQG